MTSRRSSGSTRAERVFEPTKSLAGKHETDPEMRKFVAAFEQGMRAAGWITGVSVR